MSFLGINTITISGTLGGSAVTYSVDTQWIRNVYGTTRQVLNQTQFVIYRNFAPQGTQWNTVVNITDSQGNAAS